MYVWNGVGDWWWNCNNVCCEAPASNPNTDKAHLSIYLCLLNVAFWASERRASLLIRVGNVWLQTSSGEGAEFWGKEGEKGGTGLWDVQTGATLRRLPLSPSHGRFHRMAQEGILAAPLKCVIKTVLQRRMTVIIIRRDQEGTGSSNTFTTRMN